MYTLRMYLSMLGGGQLVGRALALSVEGWGSNPRSGQVKDLKIGTCSFPG